MKSKDVRTFGRFFIWQPHGYLLVGMFFEESYVILLRLKRSSERRAPRPVFIDPKTRSVWELL